MKRRFLRCFVVIAVAAITLLWPLLASPHRIDEAHGKLIRKGMTAEAVESIFGAPAGTYDWAVLDDSTQRHLLLFYLARLDAVQDAQSDAMREANRFHRLALAAHADSEFAWGGNMQTWTSRHGSITICFDHAGRASWIGPWQKTRVEPPWKKWWEKIKGK